MPQKQTIIQGKKIIPAYTEKQWERLPEKKRKVLLARDLLLYIDSRKFDMEFHGYLGLNRFDTSYQDLHTAPAKELFISSGTTCSGCIRAGLLFASIIYRNKVEFGQAKRNGLSASRQTLNKDFTFTEQRLMEAFFENNPYFARRIKWYYKPFLDDELNVSRTVRAQYICDNIITNNGEFLPDFEDFKRYIKF